MALRPLFCLFLSGRLRQVSLYMYSLSFFLGQNDVSSSEFIKLFFMLNLTEYEIHLAHKC